MTSLRINYLTLLYLFWTIPVLAFVFSPGYKSYTVQISFAFFGSLVLIWLSKQKLMVHLTPFVLLLSPLMYDIKVFGLLYSEIIVVVILFTLIYKLKIKTKIFKNKLDRIFFSLVILAFVSFILSGYEAELYRGMINIFCLVVIYVRTRFDLIDMDDIRIFFKSLVLVSLLSSILVCASFYNGINLNDFFIYDDNIYYIYFDDYDLPRSSYFYSNIFYILGIGLILSCYFIINESIFNKILYSLNFAIILAALFLLFNKTAFLSLAIVLLLTIVYSAIRLNLRYLLFGFTAVLLAIYLFQAYMISLPLLDRIWNISSLEVRAVLLPNIIKVFEAEPLRLFFGYGPESAIRLGVNVPSILLAKTNAWGSVEGTIDSALLSFLFEYGIFFLLVFILLGMTILIHLSRVIRFGDFVSPSHYVAILIVLYLFLSSFTQVIGISKVGWVLAQLLAIYPVIIFNKHISDR